MTDQPKILPADNGPLIVENPPALTGADDVDTDGKTKVALCRCGASSNKPFCDGAHAKIDFDSTPDHARIRNKPINYTGDVGGVEVTISYTPVLCTHAAQCQARAKEVFNPNEKPWIRPENGKLESILEVIAACPSGALRVAVENVPPQHLTDGDVSISVEKNGPYHIKNVAIDADFNGVGASRTKYSLCRCGLSKNKPFCDGSHYKNWTDEIS